MEAKKYKLEFIKIAPSFEFAGVGFAGNVFITLNALTYINDSDRMYVDMETNECCCTEKDSFLHDTYNSWEYYFDQISINEKDDLKYMNSKTRPNIHYDIQKDFLNPNNYIDLKNKFFNNFKIKDYLKSEIDDFYKTNIKDKPTLGVQIRLTDYSALLGSNPKVNKFADKINSILKENSDIKQVFLATDDHRAIKELQSLISVPVIYWPNMFRADDENLHSTPYERFTADRENHRYKLGTECMKEIFTLTKCKYFLKAHKSSVSIVATILSENIQKIYGV